jgi:formamidopyrimidine-DNA glycosylase
MPEVIEVRKYTDFIQKHLEDHILLHINILKGRYKTHGPWAQYDILKASLPATLVKVDSKGKFMYMQLSCGLWITVTLGLSGGWFYLPAGAKSGTLLHGLDVYNLDVVSKYIQSATRNINVEFIFDRGTLYFYDQLSFGTIGVLTSEEQLDAKLKSIGHDIMSPSTTFEDFAEGISRQKSKDIGTAIVNQKYVSGIGNYLRADALWLSKISPFRKVADLDEDELRTLFYNVRLMVWGLYNRAEGLRLKIIKKSDKIPEDYGRQFFVYFQDTDIHGNPVVKDESFEGSQKRFIYWAPAWQH